MYDLAVLGGGIVGRIAALSCKKEGKIILYDDKSDKLSTTKHPITIRAAHKPFLTKLGVWECIEKKIQPIKRVNVSQKGHFGMIKMSAKESPCEAIAYTVHFCDIYNALLALTQDITLSNTSIKKVEKDNSMWRIVNSKDEELVGASRLLIADGAKAPLSKTLGWQAESYGPKIISFVYTISNISALHQAAGQRFTKHYTYGIIPTKCQKQYWLIMTMLEQQQSVWEGLTKAEQQEQIQADLGPMAMMMTIGKLYAKYPSKLQMRRYYSTPGVLGIGASYLSMPPVAAQGLNMALQNINTLASLNIRHRWWEADPLHWQMQYKKLVDTKTTQAFTHMRYWVDNHQQTNWWQQVKRRIAWTYLGINGSIEDALWIHGQGQNVVESKW